MLLINWHYLHDYRQNFFSEELRWCSPQYRASSFLPDKNAMNPGWKENRRLFYKIRCESPFSFYVQDFAFSHHRVTLSLYLNNVFILFMTVPLPFSKNPFFFVRKKKLLGEEDEKYKTLRQRDHLPLWVHVIADWHTSKPFTGIAWTLAKMFFILCLFYMLERQFEVITFYCELLYLQQI